MSQRMSEWKNWMRTSVLRIDAKVNGTRLWRRGQLEPAGVALFHESFRNRNESIFFSDLRAVSRYPDHWKASASVNDLWVMAGLVFFNREMEPEEAFREFQAKARSASKCSQLMQTQTRQGWMPFGVSASDPGASAAAQELARRLTGIISRGALDSLLPSCPSELKPPGHTLADFPLSEFCAMLLLAYADLRLRLTYPAAPVIAEKLTDPWAAYQRRDESTQGITPLPAMRQPPEDAVKDFFDICSDDGVAVTSESFFANYISFFPMLPDERFEPYFGRSLRQVSDDLWKTIATGEAGAQTSIGRERWMELTQNNHIAKCVHNFRVIPKDGGGALKIFEVNVTL